MLFSFPPLLLCMFLSVAEVWSKNLSLPVRLVSLVFTRCGITPQRSFSISESFPQSKTLYNFGGHAGLALTSVHYVSKDGFKLGV